MALSATENTEICKLRWPPGTKFFDISDGTHLMVIADLTEYPEGGRRVVRDITSVFVCDDTGMPIPANMIADHEFPAGTTHEEALALLGYTTS